MAGKSFGERTEVVLVRGMYMETVMKGMDIGVEGKCLFETNLWRPGLPETRRVL